MPRPPKKKPTKKFSAKSNRGSTSRRSAPKSARPLARRRRSSPQSPPVESREGDRLQKVLAAAGVASRRECEQLILEGRVEVDGEVMTELGARVNRHKQEIRIDGEPLPRPKLQYFAVHKPTGVVSTARDPAGRPRVIDLLPPGIGRMFNVGRLDLASEGLILVTNDGELANQLTHPKHGVKKIYDVTVAGQPAPDVLAQIKRGVHLAEGYVHAVDVKVKSRKKGSTVLEMVLDEGRNREIRRLLARVGHKVQKLVRIAVGPVRLGELPRGAVRALTREEVQKLRAEAAAGRRADDSEPAAVARRRVGVGKKARPRTGTHRAAGAVRPRKSGEGQGEPTRRIIGDAPVPSEAQPGSRPPSGAKRHGGSGKRAGGGKRPSSSGKRSGPGGGGAKRRGRP